MQEPAAEAFAAALEVIANSVVSVGLLPTFAKSPENTVFAIGKSILDRPSPVDIGALCLSYSGGGHTAAGTCQIENERAEAVMAELIAKITAPAH